MFQFINTLLIGLTSGAIYALMALSIVLVWRSTRVINFAQAGQALASSYFGFEALKYVDSFWVALLIAMVGGALLAAFIVVIMNLIVDILYAYIDPRTILPFYIGKGKNDRKFNHLNESPSKKENKEKFQLIQELQLLGMLPIIIELESDIDNELLAYNREDYYILKYGRKGIEPNGILTNKTI
jgi:hypothetical protein